MVEDSQETTHFGFQTVAKEQKADMVAHVANRSTFLHKACLRFFNYSDTSLPSHSFLRIKGI